MGGWGFVAAAYGIVWATIVVYLFGLKRRYHRVAAELDRLPPSEAFSSDEKK
jgi:CcmD family protein